MKEHTLLTNKEQKTYDFIEKYSKKNGKHPLLNEIAKGIGIKSKGVAHRYVKALEKAGKLKRISNKHRGMILQEKKSIFFKSLGKMPRRPIEAIQINKELSLNIFY